MHGAVTRAGEIGRPRHRSIRLLAEDAALLEALASRDSLRRRHGADASEPDLAHARELTRQSLDFMARVGATPPWLCYLTIGEDTGTLVGCCGFRGNPRDIGRGVMAPEIAYHTFPAFEGRGYATAMALRLVEVARDAAVSTVIAHTLREHNPSTRVLGRAGFAFAGEVDDPEDGLVWRWQQELVPAPVASC